MKFIQDALEECTGCKTATQVNSVDAWKDTPDPKAIVDTNTTYDDGKGIKDIVMIFGFLSHAYTKALLLTLKKEPLQGQEDPPTPVEVQTEEVKEELDPLLKGKENNQFGVASESIQQDEDNDFFMVKEFTDNASEVNFLANKFDFINQDQLPINVVCRTTLITMGDFLKVSNFSEFTQDRNESSIDHVVVVVSDSLGRTSKQTTKTNFVTIGDKNEQEKEKEFTQAVEAYVKPAGYKVFVGLTPYFDYLKTLSKTLCI